MAVEYKTNLGQTVQKFYSFLLWKDGWISIMHFINTAFLAL